MVPPTERERILLQHVELTIREQYIGRGDMLRLVSKLQGRCVQLRKKVTFAQMAASVTDLWTGECQVSSGLIGARRGRGGRGWGR